MNRFILTIVLGLIFLTTTGLCQKGPARYFGEPMLTDSLSTLFIPTKYNEEFLSSNKIAIWGDYYANIVVYNYKTDTYKKLFEQDTFIESFRASRNSYGYSIRSGEKIKNLTSKWVLLLVKPTDTNESGRIDERDPSVLFAVSTNGEVIHQITNEAENVVSFDVFNDQGFALIRIQRDSNQDKSFKNDDKAYFYRKVDIMDLSLGKEIELR
jgi:hypothetical protein